MSTRANVIIQDEYQSLYFYRHSDGYPEGAGESLREFVKGYESHLRRDPMQSAGWLILHGHKEYSDQGSALYDWKIGAYEPTDKLHGDVEYIYVIDLAKGELTCRRPVSGFWDEPSLSKTKVYKEFAAKFGGRS